MLTKRRSHLFQSNSEHKQTYQPEEPRPQKDSVRIHTDRTFASSLGDLNIHAPKRTLSPVSSNEMNKVASPPNTNKQNSTIRSVPSESTHLETPSDRSQRKSDEESRRSSRSEPMPHSTLRQSSTTSSLSQPPLMRHNGISRKVSSEFAGATRFPAPSSLAVPIPTEDPQWSSAVGRANLGKSGRVIERLMGENDMLKRELNLEKLKAADGKDAVKMTEMKIETLQTDYETKLHDAAVNKTLLKRRERQLTDLRSQVESERERADRAADSEKGWKDELDRVAEESKRKVEEAQIYARMMEGRNTTLEGYWREQREMKDKALGKLSANISKIVEARRQDDVRMNMLQSLCGQQTMELAKLREEKDSITMKFEEYKKTQDEGLRGSKDRLIAQERQVEAVLKESVEALGKLKWALNVKENVKGAQ